MTKATAQKTTSSASDNKGELAKKTESAQVEQAVANETPAVIVVETPHSEKPTVTIVEGEPPVVVGKVAREDLTQELLKAQLELRDDGFFYYKHDTRRNLQGDFAGSIREHDLYYSLTLFGVLYSGKMLAHFYNEGIWINATRGPRLDAKGNPIVAEKKPIRIEPRKAPVITEEMREAARKAQAARLAKAKLEEEAALVASKEDGAEENQPEDEDNEATEPKAKKSESKARSKKAAEENPDF